MAGIIAHEILKNPTQFKWDDESFNIDVKDLAIGGKLVHLSLDIAFSDSARFLSDDEFKKSIKRRMAEGLAEYMIQRKLIELTQIKDPLTDSFRLNARCYLAPDEQVKLLRIHNGLKLK